MEKLSADIIDACKRWDVLKAGRIADFLRFKHGFNFSEIAVLFEKHGDVSLPVFNEMMLEYDSYGN